MAMTIAVFALCLMGFVALLLIQRTTTGRCEPDLSETETTDYWKYLGADF
jgi:hypothetical protein